jgi:hypothetical protein
VLASANAINDDAELVAGTTLTVPEVTVSQNDASTFKPYDPGEIIGPTAPGLPYIPPPAGAGCNGVMMVLMAIVAVVVMVYAPMLAPAMSQFFGGAVIASGVFAGSTIGGVMAAGFVVGAAGSAVAQGVGSAMGVASFSWRQVAVDGAMAALTVGISNTNVVGSIANKLGGSQFARGAVTAVAGNLGSQAFRRVAGVETHFSWKSIAASAVSGGISASVTGGIASAPSRVFTSGMVGGIVSLHTRRALGFDDPINYGDVLADAFGNALATAMLTGTQAAESSRTSDPFSVENALKALGAYAPGELASVMGGVGEPMSTTASGPITMGGMGSSTSSTTSGLVTVPGARPPANLDDWSQEQWDNWNSASQAWSDFFSPRFEKQIAPFPAAAAQAAKVGYFYDTIRPTEDLIAAFDNEYGIARSALGQPEAQGYFGAFLDYTAATGQMALLMHEVATSSRGIDPDAAHWRGSEHDTPFTLGYRLGHWEALQEGTWRPLDAAVGATYQQRRDQIWGEMEQAAAKLPASRSDKALLNLFGTAVGVASFLVGIREMSALAAGAYGVAGVLGRVGTGLAVVGIGSDLLAHEPMQEVAADVRNEGFLFVAGEWAEKRFWSAGSPYAWWLTSAVGTALDGADLAPNSGAPMAPTRTRLSDPLLDQYYRDHFSPEVLSGPGQ